MTRLLRLRVPADADVAELSNLLRSLVVETGRVWPPRSGRGPLVLETWSHQGEITHLLGVPGSVGTTVRISSALLPGVRVDPDPVRPGPDGVSAGGEFRGPGIGKQLRRDLATPTAAALLAAFSSVRGRESVVLQWLVAPMTKGRPVASEDEPSIDDVMVVAAGRVVAWAGQYKRARSLSRGIVRLFLQASGKNGALRYRPSGRVVRQVLAQRPPLLVWPSQISLPELVGLVGWPSGVVPVIGLDQGASRLLPPPKGLPTGGPVAARANWPASTRAIRLGTTGRLRHLHVLGPTGVGKTTLLTRLALADARRGAGMVVVDPLGDLTDLIAARLPRERLDDLVIVDPSDPEHPVGLNLLAGASAPKSLEFIVGSMSRLFASSWGPRTADILRVGLLTLARNKGTTLVDFPDLLTDLGRRVRWVAAVADDPVLGGFWQWFEDLSPSERAHVIAPLMNKLRSWLLREEVVRTICHPGGELNFLDVFTKRRIVILRLPKGVLGEEIANLIGSLLLSLLWRSVLSRAKVPASRRRMAFVYLDEFQDYLRLPIGLGDLLSQARGLGVSLITAHQYLDQLPDAMRREVLANVGSRIVFRLGSADARVIARDLEPHMTARDLIGLGSREVAITVALPDRVLPPATGVTLPLPKQLRDPRQVRQAAARRYGVAIPERVRTPVRTPIGRKPRPESSS